MNLNFAYFERKKFLMEKDAIIKIIYQMKKYAKKKIEKRAKLAAKKAITAPTAKNSHFLTFNLRNPGGESIFSALCRNRK